MLWRTLFSVINRSPPQLIHEIVLVDDGSTNSNVGASFAAGVRRKIPKVKYVRRAKREGLIAARLTGARAATGEVLIFLDSHCEATVNWLPPLLGTITSARILNALK